ncbi:hypothetical protein IFM58399_10389 [Aspergillus lentulus]|uniref:uncharacterized protein n=1 Tax=Aspergillus lentulus TaxID=293939 RepID=UPI001392AFF1|nr:uncharacterized protein IFM58399_10389 [Aspergillus lentulus]GFF56744.1 hypothetical protein IFM58399_10389 [Aspergillus lentulus]
MYFSTAILASAALGGLNVYATPLPSTNESFTRTLIVSLSVRAQTVSVEQARVFQAAQSYDLTEGGGVIGRNAPYQEFPILANGRIFGSVGNDDPLTDRIVYKITIHSPVTGFPDNFAFCGVMTHLGATQNQFVLCKDI